jgi:2-methylisocitrate lyase-like PEP mutase family enzyme
MTQREKGARFQEMHAGAGAFLLPNPWDAGTARLLEGLGFAALATTSAGCAFSRGVRDNRVGRAQAMAHVAELAAATRVPLSADLEDGFGRRPEDAAETIRLAGDAGAVGGSIEDATGDAGRPVFEIAEAAERIRAAAEAARALPFPFVLTARAENFIVGRPDLGDTIARLQAYQEAGADVLYAPGLTKIEDIATVVAAVDRPVNVLAGLRGVRLSRAELGAAGVKRISVGSSLARAALGTVLRAAKEMAERGTFQFADDAPSYLEVNALFDPERPASQIVKRI